MSASPKSRHIIFNGRFLTAPATGVQRVAEELIVAVDEILAERGDTIGLSAEVYAPAKVARHINLDVIRFRQGGTRSGHLWEQLDLTSQDRRGLLVNLCNTGPILSRNAITMIHDAQAYITPESYSKAFRMAYKTVQPLMGRRHKYILTVSEFSRQQLIKYKVAPEDRIKVIYNGVDHILRYPAETAILGELGLEPNRYVVSLANVQAHKNIKVLLDSFAMPGLTDLKLVLFGGAKRDALETVFGGPLPANIVLAGKISDPSLKGLFENALCLAFPSRTEGFGLPPVEAMLVGCPAIVAPCGALPEVCGDAALYADPDSPSDWVQKISSLRDTPSLRETLSLKGRTQAQQFTWERAAKSLIALLQN
jgi:glycosyltransferase involved in cell wall biosynthesis